MSSDFLNKVMNLSKFVVLIFVLFSCFSNFYRFNFMYVFSFQTLFQSLLPNIMVTIRVLAVTDQVSLILVFARLLITVFN